MVLHKRPWGRPGPRNSAADLFSRFSVSDGRFWEPLWLRPGAKAEPKANVKKEAKAKPTMKRPTSAKREAPDVVDANKDKRCPSLADTRARDYKGGRVYIGKFAFRCIRKRYDYYSEKQSAHRSDRSGVWEKSMKATDDSK